MRAAQTGEIAECGRRERRNGVLQVSLHGLKAAGFCGNIKPLALVQDAHGAPPSVKGAASRLEHGRDNECARDRRKPALGVAARRAACVGGCGVNKRLDAAVSIALLAGKAPRLVGGVALVGRGGLRSGVRVQTREKHARARAPHGAPHVHHTVHPTPPLTMYSGLSDASAPVPPPAPASAESAYPRCAWSARISPLCAR